ncbi:amidohydrolase family protein [Streptomyces sp. NPDC051985]|uniref:amidohydrolase family protein n=1 Tax=Streptomyces sp. NPDC051985 TaxID=3155807 RepID=UPI0034229434
MDPRRSISRRRLIEATSGAAFAVTAGSAPAAAAPSGKGLPKGNWRIDTHAHYYPDVYYSYLDRYGRLADTLASVGPWSLDAHLAFMDQYRIQASVLSFGDIQLTLGPVEDRRTTAIAVNDCAHDLVRTHGDRFGAFAVTPMPDVAATVTEVERALGELGLDGVCLLTNYQGTYLGDPSLAPLYEVLDKHHAYAYVHPTGPAVNPAPDLHFGPGIPSLSFMYEYAFDATRSMTSLIYNGVLRDHPNIRWHFTHCGGTLPFLSYRLGSLHAFFPPFDSVLPEGPYEYIANLYFDDAQAFTVDQLEPLGSLVAADHIMFGTDWPAVHNLYAADNVTTLPFLAGRLPDPSTGDPEPPVDDVYGTRRRIALERDNALAQFPRLRARVPRLRTR